MYPIKEKLVLLLMFAGILFCTGIAGSGEDVENKGAEIILLSGGKMRDVHFPHHRHQDVLGDCNICHDLFPQKLGSIKELKNQGKLKKKQVMQEHCINCHRKMKATGQNTGPISCPGGSVPVAASVVVVVSAVGSSSSTSIATAFPS